MEFSKSEFEKKLMLIKNTRESIKSLSAWCLERHEHYESIICIWTKAFKNVKIEKRLTLFYLANDVIQCSKKKNYMFIDGWATSIRKSICYFKDEKIQPKIARVIKIWNKLGIYGDDYLADLISLLTTTNQTFKSAGPVQKFQMQELAVKIRSCVEMDHITDLKIKNLREANLPLTNAALQNILKKDPTHELLNELNDDVSKIESYIKYLKEENLSRVQLLNALEVAKSHYAEENDKVKIVTRTYFYQFEQLKLVQSKLQSIVGSKTTNSTIPLPDINAPPLSTSSKSIEDINLHNTTVQASVDFPALENHDHKSLTSQFTCDAPSTPSDVTFAYSEFSNQTNVSYTNNMNIHSKSSTYSTSFDEACIPTSMSSRQQFITPESSNNMVPPTNLSPLTNENTKPVFHFPQRVIEIHSWDTPVHSDWSTTDTPASPPFHEKISHQDTPIFSETDGRVRIDHCVVTSNLIDRDDRVSQEMITKTSDINHRNLISLTHLPHMNSSMVPVDVDYRAFPGISIPPPSPNFLMQAVSKPPKDNVASVDRNLNELDEKPKSNHDQILPVVLLPPLPPPMPFSYDQQCVSDVINQCEQSSQLWSDGRSSFNDSQCNIGKSDQWNHPYQVEQKQSNSNIVHNLPQLQQPRHLQRRQSKEDFRPKWKRGQRNCPRGPRNLYSRHIVGWTKRPSFGPRNCPK